MPLFRFNDSYCEEVRLRDGSLVNLRLVRPADERLLQRGFNEMSEQSRYLRFLGHKKLLSAQELSFLTEVDGINHFAIGATEGASDRREEGLGVARFIRLGNDPSTAEFAIAVIDRMQNKGLGWLLMDRLIEAALERGIRRFSCDVLAENRAMRSLLINLSDGLVSREEGSVVEAAFNLKHAPGTPLAP